MPYLKWIDDGRWNALVRGPIPPAATFSVQRVEGSTVYTIVQNGEIKIGDIVSYGNSYRTITSVATDHIVFNGPMSTLAVKSSQVVMRKRDYSYPTLATVLNQLGLYTHTIQWLASTITNPQSATGAVPLRFFYPSRHKTVAAYLSFLKQVLWTYSDMPAIISGSDYEAHFIPSMWTLNRLKISQWACRSQGKVISATNTALKTIPSAQIYSWCRIANERFFIGGDHLGEQWFPLVSGEGSTTGLGKLEIQSFDRGDWLPPQTPADFKYAATAQALVDATATLVEVNTPTSIRIQTTGSAFSINRKFYFNASESEVYTIIAVSGEIYTLDKVVTAAIGSVLHLISPDLIDTQHRSESLIQRQPVRILDYDKKDPLEYPVRRGNIAYLELKIAPPPLVGKTIVYGGFAFDVQAQEGTKIYWKRHDLLLPTRVKSSDLEYPKTFADPLVLGQSRIKLAAGLDRTAGLEYFQTMSKIHMLTSNMSFRSSGLGSNGDLLVDSQYSWSPKTVFESAYCTRNLIQVNEWCVNHSYDPRTLEEALDVLYQMKRIIEILFEYLVQIANIVALDTNTIMDGLTDQYKNDPYWSLWV